MATVFEAGYEELKKLEAENARLRRSLERIVDGYGPQHGSEFCRNVAETTLKRRQP